MSWEAFIAPRRFLCEGTYSERLTFAVSFISVVFLCKVLPSLARLYRWKEPKVHVPVLNLGEDKNYVAASDRYVHHFKDILRDGWEKFRHGVYQVWGIDGFVVIISPKFVEELNAKGTGVVDVHAASQTRIIGDYEWLRIADHLLFHSVQTDLTRHVGALLPDMREEIEYACSLHLPNCPEWTAVALWPRMIKIMALAVSRMTVGPELSRDQEWLDTMVGFLEDLFAGGWALKAWSRPLRPLAARGLVPGIRKVWKRQAKAREMLIPIIKRRRAEELQVRASGKEWERPNDLLQWMTDNASKLGGPKSDGFVAELCLVSGFGSLHASGVTLTNAVLDLAAMPEYQKVLRDENLDTREKHEGTSAKESAILGSLTKLDSFLKESQRINPTTLTAFSRQVMKPVTLSNGVHLPKGTHILAPSAMVSWDPDVYSSPEKFDGLRFHNSRMNAPVGTANRNQFTSYSSEQLHFGFGRQACPGRFFGSAVIKLIILHLLDEFELDHVDKKEPRPKNVIKGAMISPREDQEILFRRRCLQALSSESRLL